MSDNLVCWKCGASLKGLTLPLRRLEQCPECETELHICRMCVSFNPHLRSDCDEPMAEDVREKERANFCDYFKPKPNAYVPRDKKKAKEAKSRLYELFGMTEEQASSAEGDEAKKRLESLFEDPFRKGSRKEEGP